MTERLKQGLADLSHDVRVVDMRDRVLKGSRRITMRNRAFGSLAIVATLAGAVVALNAVRAMPPAPPAESPTPTVSVSPSPSSAPSSTSAPVQSIGDVRNATFLVPAFPGIAQCPAGERKFKDGKATFNDDVTLTIHDRPPVVADIGGATGEEVLVHISCVPTYGGVHQILALRVDGTGRFQPIGFVLPAGTRIDSSEEIRVADRVIEVPVVWDVNTALDRQTRGYTLQGGSFKQVSGPTAFPPLVENVREIDWRSATFGLSFPYKGQSLAGYAKVVNGTGEAILGRQGIRPGTSGPPTWVGTERFAVTVEGVVFVTNPRAPLEPYGTTACLLLTLRDAAGATRRSVHVYDMDPDSSVSAAASGLELLSTDREGVTAIERIEGTGDTVKVTVVTAGGRQTWSYQDTLMQSWKRVA